MTTLTDTKVIRHYGPNDVDAIYDGQYIGSFKTRQEAQIALDDHAMQLIEQGLVDRPLATLESQPVSQQACIHCGAVQERASCDACVEWGDDERLPAGHMRMPEGDILDTDGMRVTQMPAIREACPCELCGAPATVTTTYVNGVPLCDACAARTPGQLHTPDAPDAGAAIGRHWTRRRESFLAVLRDLDPVVWRVLAEAYCAYLSRWGTPLTPEHVVRMWTKAVENDITLPPRAA